MMLKIFPFLICLVFTQEPKINQGILDLDHWDKNKLLFLNGNWEFYWEKELLGESLNLVSKQFQYVPSNWTDYSVLGKNIPSEGYATYHLKLENVPKNENLALAMQYLGTAYNVYINDELALSVGKYSSNKKAAVNKYKSEVLIFSSAVDTVSIVFHVSSYNFKSGGIWQTVAFGTQIAIQNYKRSFLAEDMFFVGSFFIIGVFYLGLFFLPSRDKTVLYFALFSLTMSIRQMITNEGFFFDFFPDMTWDFQIRSIYLSLYLLVPTFTIFFYSLFKEVVHKLFIKIYLYASGLLFLLPLVSSPATFSKTLNLYHFVMLVGSLFLMYYLFLAIKNKIDGSALTLFGFIVVFITSINDILHANGLIQTGYYISLGVFSFILSQAMILALRSFKLTEYIQFLLNEEKERNVEITKLTDELEKTNQHLEEKIEERTHSLAMAKERAEVASETKSKFLSTMTHEFRTPLNAILGYTEIMQGYTYLSDSDKEKISIIHDSGLHLLELVNSSLEMSKIEAGKIIILSEKFNLPDLLYSIKNMFQLKCEKKDIRLSLNIVPMISDIIYSDHSKLKQILINLVGNSVKYTHKGNIDINVSSNSVDRLIVSIQDTGIGIKEEYLDRILEPFQQVNTKTNIGGTGLGLSIVLSYVEAMGGDLKIKSVYGEGTTISFNIKIAFDTERVVTESNDIENTDKKGISFFQENASEFHTIETEVYKRIEESVLIGDFIEILNIVRDLSDKGKYNVKIISYLANAASNFDTAAFDEFFNYLRKETSIDL